MKTNRRNVTIAMLVATFLAAIEVTIVSTAMPRIVSDLGGLKLISWVFAIYLLTTSVTTPIYGKLADLFGRKVIFTFGTAVFLLGSALCGLAQSMEQLIVYRAIQGIGAGAVLPVTFTIIGDIYSFEERAKIQGLFSSVWGISGIVGPLVGGFFVDVLSWHWIFFVNIPFGIIAVIMVWMYLNESFEKKKQHIDYAGAVTFTVGMCALLYAFLTGGQEYSWGSGIILTLFAVAVIFLGVFIIVEIKSQEPMLPLQLFSIRSISISNLVSFIVSAVLIAITAYLPMWIQGVYGGAATNSGLALAPMSIGWLLGAIASGQLMIRIRTRNTALIGLATIMLASLWLALISMGTSQFVIIAIMFITGLGFGLAVTVFTVTVQSSVDWKLRGAATASNSFVRTLGQTVGIALFGTLFNSAIARYMQEHGMEAGTDMNQLLSPEAASHLPAQLIMSMREGLAYALHNVFLIMCIVAVMALVAGLWMPRTNPGSVSTRSN
ncbi:MDR family MFS transporter [Aneurinibacillus aneurinilyticus]|jgi:EmrB/QacA subfamily drug resistance transporter|uniref:MDR family MFS transporter n=1 Tax=Aneurinibacillus aneurinilyticus TaxID=1391 RepID=UPI0023F09F56|nr:MDR family MFS transporter [Aneurinibacillus aneurinilyticus]MCI1694553.1 MFS transporter [Aneurinibacillus aneurinilyticus]